MQSKTSYFNKAIFLNTLRRFWPVWLLHFGAWLLILPVSAYSSLWAVNDAMRMERSMLDTANDAGIAMGIVWAALIAMCVWSFVYNSRSMSGIACLPVKRESVFISVSLAGLLPVLASHLVAALLTAAVAAMGEYNMLLPCLQSFCIISLQFIFFYGFATLCAQLTGNIIVLPAVYAVLNFTAWMVESLLSLLCNTMVYGMSNMGLGISTYLSPMVAMTGCGVRNITEYYPQYDEYITVDVVFDGWGLLIVYALVGLCLLGGAMWLYRRRRMESAGDVVAINVLKPVFKYCLSFGCALVAGMGLFMILLDYMDLHPRAEAVGIAVFMLMGVFFGYFAAEMLIAKSFRVFRGRWKGFGICALIVVLFVCALECDVFGIEKRRPQSEDVEYVCVSAGDAVCYYQPENIEKALEIHGQLIRGKADYENRLRSWSGEYNNSEYVCFTYVLKNGKSFQREYILRWASGNEESAKELMALQQLQNSSEAIAGRKALPFEFEEDSIISGYVSSWLTQEQLTTLDPDMNMEEYIFTDYYGYDLEYVEKYMTPLEKQELLDEYYGFYGMDMKISAYYNFEFSAQELYELYTQCILPDMEEGKIGLIWLMTEEEYQQNVYAASINITMQYTPRVESSSSVPAATVREPGPEGMATYTFTTTPLSFSGRTLAWLQEHGVILNTVGQQMAEQSEYDYRYKDIYID